MRAVLAALALLMSGVAGCGSDDSESSEDTAPATIERTQEAEGPTVAERAKNRRNAQRELRIRQREARQRKRELAAELRRQEAAQRKREARTGGFTGVHASNYETAKAVCGHTPKAQTARELGLSSSAGEFEIAEAYADESYTERFRQAGFEGCLAGLGIG